LLKQSGDTVNVKSFLLLPFLQNEVRKSSFFLVLRKYELLRGYYFKSEAFLGFMNSMIK